jgi:hypothetical protein
MSRRRKLALLAGLAVSFVGTTAALAHLTAPGAGAGTLTVATLGDPGPVSATSPAPGDADLSWSIVASPSGVSADATYAVERSDDGGSTWSAADSTCSGTLPRTTTSCTDTPTATGTYVYRVTASFRTWTKAATSDEVSVLVDVTEPTSGITFPADGATHNAAAYTAGCAGGTDEVCGTATDPPPDPSGVDAVEVSIQRSSDSKSWNGTTWVIVPAWNDASGTTTWSYPLAAANLTDGVTYTVQSRATDVAGNVQTTPDSKSFTFDTTAPTVTNVTSTASNGAYTVGAHIPVTVTFSDPVVVTGTPTLTLATGTPATAGVDYTGGSGTSVLTFDYTVAAGNTSSDLDYAATTSLSAGGGSIRDAATNDATPTLASPGTAGSLGANRDIVIDTTAPSILTLNRAGSSPSNASSVSWTVTFSEPVSGVTTANFSLSDVGNTLTGESITSVTGTAPTASWTIAVNTGTGSGSLQLNQANNTGVTDAAGNVSTGTATGQTYVIDRTAPTVSSINRATSSPTNAGSVQWTVTFDESVSGVTAGNFTPVNSGLGGSPAVTGVTGSSTIWTVTASTGSGSGTLGLNKTSNSGVTDTAGNALTGGNVTGQVFTIDRAQPSAADIQASNGGLGAKIDSGDVITYTFSEAMSASSIKSGWDGSSTSVTVSISTADAITVSSTNLGSVANSKNYQETSAGTATANMVMSGNTVTVTLTSNVTGGTTNTASGNNSMTWTPSTSATDVAGNAMTATARSEQGGSDADF